MAIKDRGADLTSPPPPPLYTDDDDHRASVPHPSLFFFLSSLIIIQIEYGVYFYDGQDWVPGPRKGVYV